MRVRIGSGALDSWSIRCVYWTSCRNFVVYRRRLLQLSMIVPTCFLTQSFIDCYMFMHSADRDEDALFEFHAPISKKVVGRDVNGRSTNVDVPGIIVGWNYVGMYNMSNDNGREVYKSAPPSIAPHVVSRTLPCPTPPLVNYALPIDNVRDETFKLRFDRVLKKETVDLLFNAFVHAARYKIRYSLQVDPRLKVSDG